MSAFPFPTMAAGAEPFTLGPAISAAEGGAGAQARRALDLIRQGDAAGANAAYRAAVAANSKYASTWSNLAACALFGGDPATAHRHVQQAIGLDPGCVDALVNQALVLVEGGDASGAEAALQRAVGLDPRQPLALTLLAARLWPRGDTVVAADLLATAAAQAPRHWRIALEQGRVARIRGEVDRVRGFALGAMERVLDALPERLVVRPPAKKMPVVGARAAICAAHAVLGSAKLPFYPMAGTLLGLIRDGDLLPHDKDVDLALPFDCDRDQLAALFERSPEFHVPPRPPSVPGRPSNAFGVVHRPTGITVDLFFVKHEDDGITFGFGQEPQAIYSRMRPFGFAQMRWLDRLWTIPSPAEQYFEDLYGPDWRTPDPYFDSAVSNYSRLPESIPLVFDLGLLRLGDALQQRDWLRAHSLCRQLLARIEEPTVVAVREQLERRCAELQR